MWVLQCRGYTLQRHYKGESRTMSHLAAFTENKEPPLTVTSHTWLRMGCKLKAPLEMVETDVLKMVTSSH